ncbi:hypothetical protein EGR_08673 [Echinococcus granulosus]|uniref:Uncharacterized protein n=1 Tax=Echinococcus granulosus TaxID=6210 RepID=W6U7Z2_ECHGR|nr:hypothetical protein EGR_08673 [Echinococcus granulosus]EUB56451.1 hypothetical protein EGR_08673 [Echinococcus granulosus]
MYTSTTHAFQLLRTTASEEATGQSSWATKTPQLSPRTSIYPSNVTLRLTENDCKFMDQWAQALIKHMQQHFTHDPL